MSWREWNKKGSSEERQKKGGQGRTKGGMLGMGKSRKTVTGDGVEKKKCWEDVKRRD